MYNKTNTNTELPKTMGSTLNNRSLKNKNHSLRTENRTEQNRTEIYYDLDICSLSSYYTKFATMQAIT